MYTVIFLNNSYSLSVDERVFTWPFPFRKLWIKPRPFARKTSLAEVLSQNQMWWYLIRCTGCVMLSFPLLSKCALRPFLRILNVLIGKIWAGLLDHTIWTQAEFSIQFCTSYQRCQFTWVPYYLRRLASHLDIVHAALIIWNKAW